MNELRISFYEKIDSKSYPLLINNSLQKETLEKLKELLIGVEIDIDNLKWWSVILQQTNLDVFSSEEIEEVVSIDIVPLFNKTNNTKYFYQHRNKTLYDINGLVKASKKKTKDVFKSLDSQEYEETNLDISLVNEIYKEQVKPGKYFSKTLIQDLLINF